MYIFFIIMLTLIVVVTFYLNRMDLMAPPTIMTGMFLLCSIFGFYRYNDWKYEEFSVEAAFFLLIGILCFGLSGMIATNYIRRQSDIKYYSKEYVSRIEVSILIPIILFFIGIFQLYTLYRQILRIVIELGYNHSTLAQTLYVYRIINMSGQIPEEYRLSSLYSLLKYFVESSAAVGIYIFLFNSIAIKRIKKKDLMWLAVIGLWPLNAILTTSRGDLLNIIAMAFYLIYFFLGLRQGFNQKTELSVLKRGLQLLTVFLVVFLFISIKQGRVSNGFISYISTYTNGGIRNFDLYIKDPIPFNQGIIGNDETLRYVSILVNRLTGSHDLKTLALEFRNIGGVNTGNIYTAFRRYYSDFGIFGIMLFSSFLGYFMTRMYIKAKSIVYSGTSGFYILIFAWLSKPIFYFAIEDSFYVSVVTLNGLIRFIYIWLMFKVLVEKKIRVKVL